MDKARHSNSFSNFHAIVVCQEIGFIHLTKKWDFLASRRSDRETEGKCHQGQAYVPSAFCAGPKWLGLTAFVCLGAPSMANVANVRFPKERISVENVRAQMLSRPT